MLFHTNQGIASRDLISTLNKTRMSENGRNTGKVKGSYDTEYKAALKK